MFFVEFFLEFQPVPQVSSLAGTPRAAVFYVMKSAAVGESKENVMSGQYLRWLRWTSTGLSAALSSGLLASNLGWGQAPPRRPMPQPMQPVPAGVVSEQAEDDARRGTTAQQPANAAQATPASPAASIATNTPTVATRPTVQLVPVTAATGVPTAAGVVPTAAQSTTTTTVTGTATIDPNAAAAALAVNAALTADNTQAADFGLWLRANPQGALTVADLATTGPIAGLGLVPGDTIVSLNGQPITTERQLVQLLLTENLRNQPLNLVVTRSGANQAISITPANLIQGMVQADPLFQAGVVLDTSNPNQLIVQRVFPRTPAYYAGLRTGDVLTSVGGQRVVIPADLQRLWTANNVGLPVQVTRAGQSRGLLFSGGGMFNSQATTPGRTTFSNQAATGATNVGGVGAPVAGAINNTTAISPVPTASPTAIAPPAAVNPAGGTLFPNAIAPPAAGIPGSTQRVPVTIPGATNPPAGNPLTPAPVPAGTIPTTAPGQ